MENAKRSALSLVTFICVLFGMWGGRAGANPGSIHHHAPIVDDYKITILSDSIPGRYTIGEWGFSALVEVTSGGITKRFLFDTGDKPGTVLDNASTLGFDICDIEDVVLSHHHADHTGGLDNLRRGCAAINPNAFRRAHVGAPEIFWPRIDSAGKQKNPMVKEKSLYEAQGGVFIVNDRPHQFLLPGVYLTGRIFRTHDEKTYLYTTPTQIQDPSGQLGLDLIPEDQALVINTAGGAVILTGCAHAGAVNTIEQAIRIVGGWPKIILAGGLHWYQMEQGDWHTAGTLDWEAHSIARLNVVAMLGSHCTGFERFIYVRNYLGFEQKEAAISAVGTVMETDPMFTFTVPQALNNPLTITHDNGRFCRH